jgi:transcriptional regulator with XRE-family HTH domain
MADVADPGLAVFARVIRQVRVFRELTQDELAERAGVHRTHVGYVERAQRDVRLSTILKLANALDMTPGELFAAFDRFERGEPPIGLS